MAKCYKHESGQTFCVGDRVKGVWFDDPTWYEGTVKSLDGELGIECRTGDYTTWGQLEGAFELILLSKAGENFHIVGGKHKSTTKRKTKATGHSALSRGR